MSPDDELMTLIFAFFHAGLVVPVGAFLWAFPFAIAYGILTALRTKWNTALAAIIPALLATPVTIMLATNWPLGALLGNSEDLSGGELGLFRTLFSVAFVATFVLLSMTVGLTMILSRVFAGWVRARRALSEAEESSG